MSDRRVRALVEGLIAERRGLGETVDSLAACFGSERLALQALMNTRPAGPADPEWLALQDQVLSEENAARAVAPEFEGRIGLWRGDITRLRVDGIVNAANSAMLGCFGPLHRCIDNAIHSAAGVQLRNECAEIIGDGMLATGDVRVTRGWNLSAAWVIHTVGPIVSGPLTADHEAALARCYDSIFAAAIERGMHTVAPCCVSTGVFGFPSQRAAEIAVERAKAMVEATGVHVGADEGGAADSDLRVLFCVFSEADLARYEALLR